MENSIPETNAEANKDITFKYVFPDDYNPKYVNGAYGGVSSKGEIIISFFLERHSIPRKASYELAGTELINEKLDPENKKSMFIRFIECGITLNETGAVEIYNFLGKHIEKLKALKQESGNEIGTPDIQQQ
jgi:hypothetical protein